MAVVAVLLTHGSNVTGDPGALGTSPPQAAQYRDTEPRTSLMTEQDSPCLGSSLDLGELLFQRSCEVFKVPEAPNLSGKIEPMITLSPERVAGGDTVAVRMSFRNVSDGPVDLYFTAHVGPMTRVVVAEEATGNPVFPPPDMPPSPFRPGPPYPVRGTVLPGGEIYREINWEASKREWIPDALPTPVSLPPMRTTGPLPEGTYLVRMHTMFHFAGYGLEQPVARLQVTRTESAKRGEDSTEPPPAPPGP